MTFLVLFGKKPIHGKQPQGEGGKQVKLITYHTSSLQP